MDETTIGGRLLLNYAAVEMIVKNINVALFGGGVLLFEEYRKMELGVHNEYLSQAMRFGLPAIFLFVMIIKKAIETAFIYEWRYSVPLMVLVLVFILESATGSQLQNVFFLVIGFIECSKVIVSEQNQLSG
jgi:hypothetical protein